MSKQRRTPIKSNSVKLIRQENQLIFYSPISPEMQPLLHGVSLWFLFLFAWIFIHGKFLPEGANMDNPSELFSVLGTYLLALFYIILSILSLILKRETVVTKDKITSKILPFNWYKREFQLKDFSTLSYHFEFESTSYVCLRKKDGSHSSSIYDMTTKMGQTEWFIQEVSSFTGLKFRL